MLQADVGTIEDIRWVEEILSLPPNAFGEPDSARCGILLSIHSADVSACPGSGKTTLAVAKIGVLVRHWKHATRGICVLSHTNAARGEIERRLSKASSGRSLLSYPHYVGTIHSFVNEFLGLPYLRSLGFPVKMIDTDMCSRRRWSKLQFGTKKFLDNKNIEATNIFITDPEFNFTNAGSPPPFGTTTPTYKNIQAACEAAAREGYHCYDDMFMWANQLLSSRPDMIQVLRARFPVVVIDEAQDNSEMQSSLLYALFPPDDTVRYRFGDPNQAIFDFFGGSGATTDVFPAPELTKPIPDSHRFGQKIADFADPLGVAPYGLHGLGPRDPLSSGLPAQNTIFVFEEKTIHNVLPRYGDLLLKTFSDQELSAGIFTAVGQVHSRPISYKPSQFPKYVGDYLPNYDPELGSRDSRPSLFIGYMTEAQRRIRETRHTAAGVAKFAEGLIRIAQLSDSGKAGHPTSNAHRFISERLDSNLLSKYFDIVSTYLLNLAPLDSEAWSKEICPAALEIAAVVNDAPIVGKAPAEFLQWVIMPASSAGVSSTPQLSDNRYRHSADGREALIRVGSIHSVKGETHTATLVLETFWNEHNIASLLPWLTGQKKGGSGAGKRDSLRLRVQYVAMTRPTHLVCLALHQRSVSLNACGFNEETIGKFQALGWNVVTV